MLTDTLHRVPRSNGRQLLVKRGTGGSRELTAWRLHLPAGATDEYVAPKEETIVVLQDGRGTFSVGDRSWTVSRSGVFSERATALYVPPNMPLRVAATADLEAVLVSAEAAEGSEPAIVRSEDVRVNARGRGNYAR